MKGDTEGEVHSCQDDGPFELVEEETDQASLEDEGVEEHEENDDDVEEDRNILDAADTRKQRTATWRPEEDPGAGPESYGTPRGLSFPGTYSPLKPQPKECRLRTPNDMKTTCWPHQVRCSPGTRLSCCNSQVNKALRHSEKQLVSSLCPEDACHTTWACQMVSSSKTAMHSA